MFVVNCLVQTITIFTPNKNPADRGIAIGLRFLRGIESLTLSVLLRCFDCESVSAALLVKRDTHTLDMLNHIQVADVTEKGQINCIGQQQVVEFMYDLV
jgi:hypothetical protein